MERRDFLRRLGLTTAGVVAGVTVGVAVKKEDIPMEEFHPRYVDPIPSASYSDKWSQMYDGEIDEKIWQDLYDKYGKGLSIFDMLHITKT